MIGLITCSVTASRRSAFETFSLCWVEITRQSTRAGQPLRYSIVTGDDCDTRRDERLASQASLRVLLHDLVKDGVRNLVGDSVRMALGDGLRRKQEVA